MNLFPWDNAGSIYIHIPFCRQACHYCNFHFSTSLVYKDRMVECLLKELTVKNDFLLNTPIHSIYFGGGTPSLLDPHQIQQILKRISEHYNLAENVEISLELNPDDLDEEKLNLWMKAGINRLSVGVQSLDDEILSWMNRSHTSKEIHTAIEIIQKSGILNYTVDLIFGLPNTDLSYWKRQLDWIAEIDPPHVSCYNLTIEDRTVLFKQVEKKICAPLEDKEANDQFIFCHEFLENLHYEHYEISSFARDKMYSRHNCSYWFNFPYLGIGPSANSYKENMRYWNKANNASYMESIEGNGISWEMEELSASSRFNESIMLGLRTKWGLDQKTMMSWEKQGFTLNPSLLNEYQEKALLTKTKENIALTKEGMLLADHISSSFFIVD